MESGDRRNTSRIVEDIIQRGPEYHVWQAVWLTEIATKKDNPGRKDYLFDQLGLKFRPYQHYDYPPRDIKFVSRQEKDIEFVLTFLGLYGINSPIPRCYHEQISFQEKILGEGKIPLQNFLDIFNNRFYWLYYQSWKKYKFYLHLNGDVNNKISERINSFIGRGSFTKHKSSTISDFTLLKFAGVFSQRVRNKEGLKILLGYMFPRFPITIKEFVPHWVELVDVPKIGSGDFRLGKNSFIGEAVIDYMSRICLEIGPVSFEDYLDFLPGTLNAKKLNELLNLYLNDGLEYDVQFKIKADTIEEISWDDDRLKLGTTVWLGKPSVEQFEVYIDNEEFNSVN
ncbi:MAG: type VI secretion system baseplate subunit TssG [Ignavibacteriaceae bacterium]|jgi:type VI secretion system protein ImpH|nr:type VI secretion system baseplate subunit TssG [Ignavibacterium sp.]MCC6255168.1 type VI secretion system baseplate subunit TssG [Ignavibacteriaceae bacterium]HRN25164.1 type VI secretion system baseplate subunit TssG [Ignavibacteriaceae bacterium]HRP92298.1 type VI secretion system baseplate subunit TssG [Ignavibacteriaceae bacterium]HRQ53356.1 type VI secretion system baseplate subunit TssG [Ignavibacteriaceae bacterium]